MMVLKGLKKRDGTEGVKYVYLLTLLIVEAIRTRRLFDGCLLSSTYSIL